MLADEYSCSTLNQSIYQSGKLDKNALPCISRDAVLDVIESGLIEFSKRKEAKSINNEKGITNRLCKILNRQKLLYFHHEGMQDETKGTSPGVDIEAIAREETLFEARTYSQESTLMAIEAKRLPAPPPKSREREYLVGSGKNCGGVERFKLGIHGTNALTWTILGYVQKNNFSVWKKSLNEWISELAKNKESQTIWKVEEQLEVITENNTTARFRSKNNRLHNRIHDEIEIIHLWILLNEKHA